VGEGGLAKVTSYPSSVEPPDVPGVSALVRIDSRGFARVYRGRQTETGRGVAVKVLPASLDRTGRALFDREQSRIRQLRDASAILPVEVRLNRRERVSRPDSSVVSRLQSTFPVPPGTTARLVSAVQF